MNSIRVSMCVVNRSIREILTLSIAYLRSCGSWTSEESINVNNILKETPFGVGVLIGAKVFIDSSVDLLSHFESLLGGELDGLSFLGTSHGDEGKSCVFEHHC